jgi:hypothetical protein
MRKLIISAVATASILTVATAANAGYWFAGVYYPYCFVNWYGYWVCY